MDDRHAVPGSKTGDATADHGLPDRIACCETTSLAILTEVDAQMLVDELAQMPASLNHHLSRLVETGLIGFTNEGKAGGSTTFGAVHSATPSPIFSSTVQWCCSNGLNSSTSGGRGQRTVAR